MLRYRKSMPLESRTLEELGLLLKLGRVSSGLRLGRVTPLVASAIVGKAEPQCKELTPLPFTPPKVEETRLLQAIRGGAACSDSHKDFAKTLKVAGRSAWLFLVTVAPNFLTCGHSAEDPTLLDLGRVASPAHTRSIQYIENRVDFFLDTYEAMPHTDWSSLRSGSRSS